MEIVVTDGELWIKGILPMFSYIGTKHDLTHRIPLKRITKNISAGNRVELWFLNESGGESNVELRIRDIAGFNAAVGFNNRKESSAIKRGSEAS